MLKIYLAMLTYCYNMHLILEIWPQTSMYLVESIHKNYQRRTLIIGHVNNVPTMQFFTGISRNTQSKPKCYHWVSVSGNLEIMHYGILINMLYYVYCALHTTYLWSRKTFIPRLAFEPRSTIFSWASLKAKKTHYIVLYTSNKKIILKGVSTS